MTGCIAILNARAGTLIDGVAGDPETIVREAFARIGFDAEIVLAQPADMPDAIRRACAGAHDHIFVGGGDGTLGLAAACLAGTDKTLGLLPLGTLNLLARDFGGPTALEEAIAAFEGAEARRIDLARVNGRDFHSVCGLGFFTQIARAREETRGFVLGRWVGLALAMARAFLRTGPMRLEVEIDGRVEKVKAYALLVTNNVFEEPDRRRRRLDAGVLGLHIAHEVSLWRRLTAGVDVLAGKWRENATIETRTVRSMIVRSVRPKVWLSVDGEITRMTMPLEFELRPKALSVLWPRQAEAPAPAEPRVAG